MFTSARKESKDLLAIYIFNLFIAYEEIVTLIMVNLFTTFRVI